MKTYTSEQLAEILGKHRSWLRGEEGGERANLSGADLSGTYLRGANLSGADLRGTYLRGADLSGTYLRGANLSGADLSGTYLSDANLSGADLSDLSSIWGASGNCCEVKAIQCDHWPVTYTAERMQIGCQFHTLTEWWAFTEDEIGRMDGKALGWWKVWKPILKNIIELSPAVPCGAAP
ncbi:pentapeptide repeat-containing protein [Pseudomonas prosekii]|uniref:Pentapeptide repeat-containing protein n=1 Tax=Pseudomonas prosekii TaxID=1148509 RepID=A0A1H2B296_9PSED|nr:pentapeptide repeat-containing protein [Pseudomonas prosekii]SDT52119.1 Pentapeptide repeat-containing protein [Pseudomonas prosekii]